MRKTKEREHEKQVLRIKNCRFTELAKKGDSDRLALGKQEVMNSGFDILPLKQ